MAVMRSAMSWAVVLLLVAGVRGQDPARKLDRMLLTEVEQRLQSESDAEVAWGGYLAHRYRLRGATRSLSAGLERYRARDDIAGRIVRLHLVDGLLGAGARVPAEQVEFLLEDALTRGAALAVLALEPQANREALTRTALAPAERGDLARQAAGRLLVVNELCEPKLGAFVADNLRFELSMHVVDDKTSSMQWDSAMALAGDQANPDKIDSPIGFPPLVRLRLATSRNAENTVRMVVPRRLGGSLIALTREEKIDYWPFELERGRFSDVPSQHELNRLLKAMAGVSVNVQTEFRHEWQDAATCREAFCERRDKVRAKLDKAVEQLRKRGWLVPSERPGMRIELVEKLVDERGDRGVGLPEIPAAAPLGR